MKVDSMIGDLSMSSENNTGDTSASVTSNLSNAASDDGHSADYLAQLLKDKKQLGAFPNVFSHLDRLVDDEIQRVRMTLFQLGNGKKPLTLPDPIGPIVTVQEKVFIPVKEFPDYNFVGRILGPRGMTAKQLEQETGCKVMIRGRGSMRDKQKEDMNRGKPNWEHLNEELHVLIVCEDTENRSALKLQRCVDEIKKLLVPAPEGEDELKRKQLMELAIMNGTYRPGIAQSKNLPLRSGFLTGMDFADTARLMQASAAGFPLTGGSAAAGAALRANALGAPIILSPTRLSPSAGGLLNAAAASAAELGYGSGNGLGNFL